MIHGPIRPFWEREWMWIGQKQIRGANTINTQSAVDFAAAGISHVRIRIADKVDQELLEGLDRQISLR